MCGQTAMREPPAPRGRDLAITADRYAEASARVIPHNLGILPRNETQNITATSPTNGDTIEERRTERAPSTWPRAANSLYPPPSPSATPVSGLQGSRTDAHPRTVVPTGI